MATFPTHLNTNFGICEVAGEEGARRVFLWSFVFVSSNLKNQSASLLSGAQEFSGIFLFLLYQHLQI